jgi:hypothetical protein
MPIFAKIIVTALIVAIMIAAHFVNPHVDNTGPDWIWHGLKTDPVRRLFFHKDGTLKRFTKSVVLVLLGLTLLILWLVLPTNSC